MLPWCILGPRAPACSFCRSKPLGLFLELSYVRGTEDEWHQSLSDHLGIASGTEHGRDICHSALPAATPTSLHPHPGSGRPCTGAGDCKPAPTGLAASQASVSSCRAPGYLLSSRDSPIGQASGSCTSWVMCQAPP